MRLNFLEILKEQIVHIINVIKDTVNLLFEREEDEMLLNYNFKKAMINDVLNKLKVMDDNKIWNEQTVDLALDCIIKQDEESKLEFDTHYYRQLFKILK